MCLIWAFSIAKRRNIVHALFTHVRRFVPVLFFIYTPFFRDKQKLPVTKCRVRHNVSSRSLERDSPRTQSKHVSQRNECLLPKMFTFLHFIFSLHAFFVAVVPNSSRRHVCLKCKTSLDVWSRPRQSFGSDAIVWANSMRF